MDEILSDAIVKNTRKEVVKVKVLEWYLLCADNMNESNNQERQLSEEKQGNNNHQHQRRLSRIPSFQSLTQSSATEVVPRSTDLKKHSFLI